MKVKNEFLIAVFLLFFALQLFSIDLEASNNVTKNLQPQLLSNNVSFLRNVWKFSFNHFYVDIIQHKRLHIIIDGLKTTLLISALACLFGTFLGAILCLFRFRGWTINKILSRLFTQIVAGIPEMLLLMMFYFVIFARSYNDPIFLSVLTFSLNFAARFSIILENSIASVDSGQKEAAYSLGMSKGKTFFKITFPQALRKLLPLYQTRIINLVWWTSIVGYISVQDLTLAGKVISKQTLDSFTPFILVGILYMSIAWFITFVISKIELNLSHKKRRLKVIKNFHKRQVAENTFGDEK